MANPISNLPNLPQTGPATTSGAREADDGSSTARQVLAGSGSPTPAPQTQELPRQSPEQLQQATRDISDYIQSVSRSLNISVDGDLGTTVIQVVDAETEELVRQIPAEEILQLARFLSDQQASADNTNPVRGLLIDQEG